MVSRKALFNVAIQIIPILASLFAIPISISNLGKPLWFFYSLGITVLFLPNYFAFGAGPYLVRNLVQKNNFLLTKKWKGCISAIIISSIVYVLFSSAFLFTTRNQDAFILNSSEKLFYVFFILSGLMIYIMILFKAILESKEDFYFLGTARAFFTTGLIVIPVLSFQQEWHYALSVFLWSIIYVFVCGNRIGNLGAKWMQNKNLIVSKQNLIEYVNEVWPFGVYLFCWSFFLFFDRIIFKFFIDKNILSDHVTMQDLFNRVAIISGNISLVYYPTLSEKANQTKLFLQHYFKQLYYVLFAFAGIIITSSIFLEKALIFWLKDDFSTYISNNALVYLVGIIVFNFSIIQVRALQAINKEKLVALHLIVILGLYILFVLILGLIEQPKLLPYGQIAAFITSIIIFHKKLNR
jgi:O-antigen/teichoic acid export membrane protein|tara:strand:+ start:861 stop:2087 length:1227 start_codon:yes stop_codon:yes gene_type:complete